MYGLFRPLLPLPPPFLSLFVSSASSTFRPFNLTGFSPNENFLPHPTPPSLLLLPLPEPTLFMHCREHIPSSRASNMKYFSSIKLHSAIQTCGINLNKFSSLRSIVNLNFSWQFVAFSANNNGLTTYFQSRMIHLVNRFIIFDIFFSRKIVDP